VCLVTVLAWSGPDQSGHVEVRARSQRDAHAGRPRRARPSGSTPTKTPTPPRSSRQPAAQLTVPATPAGYRRLLRLADRYDGWRVWAIESPGGDGAGLTRFLQAQGEQVVVELDRPSGPLAATAPSPIPGATRAAREAWPRPPRPAPSSRSPGGAVGAAGRPGFGGPGGHRRQRQLHALVVAAPGPLRGRLGNLTTPRLVVTCGRLRQQATGMSRPPPPRPRPCGAWPAASTS
jgi:hypothetical protein